MESNEPKATTDLVAALARARAKFHRVEKDGSNPHLHNRYATLGAVLDAVTGPLLEEGIVAMQTPVPIDGGKWALQTTLRHTGGGELAGLVPLEYGEARGLNPMQALGSAISYGRRYGLLSLLCLTAEDDDGAGVGHPPQQSHGRAAATPAAPARQRGTNSNRSPGPAPTPSAQELREKRAVALNALKNKPPRTGKGLFRLIMDLDPERGLLNAVNEFGSQQGWGPKLVEWSEPHVMEAIGFVRDEMEVQAQADRELN